MALGSPEKALDRFFEPIPCEITCPACGASLGPLWRFYEAIPHVRGFHSCTRCNTIQEVLYSHEGEFLRLSFFTTLTKAQYIETGEPDFDWL